MPLWFEDSSKKAIVDTLAELVIDLMYRDKLVKIIPQIELQVTHFHHQDNMILIQDVIVLSLIKSKRLDTTK